MTNTVLDTTSGSTEAHDSLPPNMFTRQQTIGSTQVNVTEKPVVVLSLARAIADAKTLKGNDDTFMIVNLDAVVDRFALWKRELPRVDPYYAIKCNTDDAMAHVLASLGAGYDCASREEIDYVRGMGVPPERIIYANTFKTRNFIEHAETKGVNMMTFDNVEELEKIVKHHTCSEPLLRIAASDPTATKPLTFKFGADPVTLAPRLLKRAAELGVNIVGVSFHIGSGCNDPGAFYAAIQQTRKLFDLGVSLGHKMNIVNIGGGFPGGEYHVPFEKFAAIIRSALAEFFPEPNVRFMAEPGRFFAARPFTLLANVIARTAVPAEKITKNASDAAAIGHEYCINDGCYGSFCCKKNQFTHPVGRPLHDREGVLYPSIVWGPTCDSNDVVESNTMLPSLEVGDWLMYEDIGAYTCSAASTFNGFALPTPIHVIGEHTWKALNM